MRTQTSKIVGHWESNPKREIHRITCYLKKNQKNVKAQINNLHLKELEKEKQTKPKVSRRKEIIKIRAERNIIECKKR